MTASSSTADTNPDRGPGAPAQVSPTTRAHASLLPYALSFLAANIAIQLVIVATGNRITLLSTVLLGAAALGYAIYLLTIGRTLGRVRYARLVAHAFSYAVVNVGFGLHAYILFAAGSPAIQGDGYLPMDPRWFGATFGMASFWGIGLILHGLGALLDRGFEASRA